MTPPITRVPGGPQPATQPAPQPGPQQTLNAFYSSAQQLADKIKSTPGLRDKLDDDLHVAEFLSALDRVAKVDCSEDDVRQVQGFLRNNLKLPVGDADGKVGPKLVQGLQKAFGPLSKYTPPPIPLPVPRPANLGNYASNTAPAQSVSFPDRSWSTPPASSAPPAQNVTGPAPLTSSSSRSAEASAVIADVAKAISARSGSSGGYCFSGVKSILSQLDKVGQAAELGPKSKEYKQLLARYPGLKPTLAKLSADPGLAEAVRRGQMVFPPNSVSAFMARASFDAPDSPYRLVSEGTNDSVDAESMRDPRRFPPGSVIVWDRSPLLNQAQAKGPDGKPTAAAKAALSEIAKLRKQGEWETGHIHGHIAVIGGNGREYSDRDYAFSPHYGGGNYRVYTLK